MLLCLFGIVATLSLSILHTTRWKLTDIGIETSPDGQYSILFQEKGEPDWPFGKSHARITVYDGKQVIKKFDEDVADDGGRFQKSNYYVNWLSTGVVITFRGSEQHDQEVIVMYDGSDHFDTLLKEIEITEFASEHEGSAKSVEESADERQTNFRTEETGFPDEGTDSINDIQSETIPSVIEQSVVTDPTELRIIHNKCSDIITLCQDLLLNAETETSEYFPYETTMTQRTVDQIESSSANAGYPVINTDGYFPRYLDNSEGISRFGESISNNIADELEIISVYRCGQITYCLFQYCDGEMAYNHTIISAGENNQLDIDKTIIEIALEWGMTPKGDFYYQILPLNSHWDAYILIREKPVNNALHDLAVKYVYPIGYCSNNMFLTDWSDSDFGRLCFNDLFEYLYRQQNGDYLYPDDFDFRFNSDMCCYMIPSALFEGTITPFFDVSIDELRKRTRYDAADDSYPWQAVDPSNIVYFPTMTPEVCGLSGK